MAKSCFCYSPLHLQHLTQHQNRNLVQFKYPTFPSPRPHHQNLIFLLNFSPSVSSHYHLFAFPPRRPNFVVNALDSDTPHHQGSVKVGRNESYEQWDSLTSKFSGAANIPFLLLQMPQIILNARNLMSGNKTALFAITWLGMLTSLLGNLSLLSYFAKKREKEAMVVQTLGVVSTYVVLVQLALAETMPLPYFLATSVVVAAGLVLNFMNYFGLLNAGIWRFWEDFITIGGLSVLPQIMWSTFVPFIPNSILPGAISFVIAILAVTMARSGKLSEEGVKFVGGISGWTATLLFMWMPVSQMWTNFLNPENMKGLSAVSMLLAMLGNGLMLPRALLIRDFMWFTGSAWATFFYGYGNLACLFFLNIISKEFFLAATVGLVSWIG
ncbi:Maltose excess protein 1, chloroplastic [Sesbania bispinosa]|nr:Maltose excess protein 1, chloroplastic [Sesbania bispinosa]